MDVHSPWQPPLADWLEENRAFVNYSVDAEGEYGICVELRNQDGALVASGQGKSGVLTVENPHLWQVRNAYLYTLTVFLKKGTQTVDRYDAKAGIRTVAIEKDKILINGQPVYLKGFGKHEDSDILGRGFNYTVAKRDFECMKRLNANCFRTSHYPYAEEWYRMADEEGFLIIDETPGVGMMRSIANFLASGAGKSNGFFGDCPDVNLLLKNHKAAVEEMDQWAAKNLNVPFVFTEFGTDTLDTLHKLPGVMWSQEYQSEYMDMNFSVFDRYAFVQSELAWNFADFQTGQGVFRVNGNKRACSPAAASPKTPPTP